MSTPNEQLDGLDSDLAAAGQMIESLRQQLALATQESGAYREAQDRACEERDDHIKREVMLRDALDYVIHDLKLRADLNEDDPGVIELGDGALQQAEEALAATADLKDVILCHAEPVGWIGKGPRDGRGRFIEYGVSALTPFYCAWEPKP